MLFLGFGVWQVVNKIFLINRRVRRVRGGREEREQKKKFTIYLTLLIYRYKVGNLSEVPIKCLP